MQEICECPNNIKEIDEGTWKTRKITKKFLKHPSDRNEFNDCKDFDRLDDASRMLQKLTQRRHPPTGLDKSIPRRYGKSIQWESNYDAWRDNPIYREMEKIEQQRKLIDAMDAAAKILVPKKGEDD